MEGKKGKGKAQENRLTAHGKEDKPSPAPLCSFFLRAHAYTYEELPNVYLKFEGIKEPLVAQKNEDTKEGVKGDLLEIRDLNFTCWIHSYVIIPWLCCCFGESHLVDISSVSVTNDNVTMMILYVFAYFLLLFSNFS